MSNKSIIENYIKKNKNVLFSLSYCPWCIKSKDLLKEQKIKCKLIEVDIHNNKNELNNILKEMTGSNSYPKIFLNQHF